MKYVCLFGLRGSKFITYSVFCPASTLLQLLYDTFSAFGVIVNNPKIMRDPDTGLTKGFGFLAFDSFEASGEQICCPACKAIWLGKRLAYGACCWSRQPRGNPSHV